MEVNLDKYDTHDLVQLMRNMDIPCQGKVVSKQSKYCGKTFDIQWAGYWGIALKVMPINRVYNYISRSVEITPKSLQRFKTLAVDTIPGAVDFFGRPLKAEDVIFYGGELHRISFFIDSEQDKVSYFTKNVSIEAIRPKHDWEDFDEHSEFLGIDRLLESVLIDDPLLLLKL